MPNTLSIDDFKSFSNTCEVRYKDTYLIFDRTGQIIEDLRDFFTDIHVSSPAPSQTAFTAREGSLGIEANQSRFTSGGRGGNELFAKQCHSFFDVVVKQLNINVLTRIGLRYVLRKEYKTLDESKAALAAMMLANLKPTKRFNSSDSPVEVMFRWEDAQIGATVRLRAEGYDIHVAIPPEFADDVPKFDKRIEGLTLDVDYYTVAPVEREQWNCREWLLQKSRIIGKEINGILQGGK